MNGSRFDDTLRMLTRRRSLEAGTVAVLTGLIAAPGGARKKRKHKDRKPKAKPNAFGCFEVGDPCRRASDCCSSICKGKKGKRTCRAHDEGTCPQGVPDGCTSLDPRVRICNGTEACDCYRTTAGSNACLEPTRPGSVCADCHTDADCLALGLPVGSACVPVTEGDCEGSCVGATACLAPCSVPALEA
jgi:hypothetical protein